MKISKVAIASVAFCSVVILSASCTSANAASTVKNSTAAVQKGSLSVAVTGTGNLAFSTSQDLAFEVAGYVNEIMVKEGESVKKGQELAKLDTSDWDKQVKKLETALTTAQRSLDSKKRALTKAQDLVTSKENAVTKARRDVTSKENDIAKAERLVITKELAVRSSELDLETAKYNVTKVAEVKTIQDDIDNADDTIKLAQSILSSNTTTPTVATDFAYWAQLKAFATTTKASAEAQMQEVLKGTSIAITTDVKIQVAKAQLQVEQSQRSLLEAKIAVDDAKFAVETARLAKKDADLAVKDTITNKADAEQGVADAQTAVDDAQQAVTDAQKDLDEAKALSPIITAPFDGFIPKINAKGGDEVFKGSVAMQIANPSQFEAVILVSEKNISYLKVGQIASVALDALSGVSFPAQITKIAPLATTSQGVVNYQVTIALTSTQPTSRALSGTEPAASGIQRPSGNFTAPGMQGGTFQRPTASGSAPTRTPGTSGQALTAQTISLKSGMSAVVTIVIQQKDNVLKVPSRAITRQGQNSTVEVVTANGTETRTVKTGMSDNSYTEITEGLSEGEQVVIKAATTTTPTGNQPRIAVPGMGGFR